MTQIFTLNEIKNVVNPELIISSIEEGFILYEKGQVVLASLSSLDIENYGLAKIKYGYIKGQKTYLIKVGSFYPGNSKINLPTINASMQIYNQHTGEFEALLLDEAYLTNVRTAAAGATVSKYFSPKKINKIGIIGTGVQAKLQSEYIKYAVPCREIMVYGRNVIALEEYKKYTEQCGFNVEVAKDISQVTSHCNLIVTTTSAKEPIIHADQVQNGTLIISVGADTQNKCEIDSKLLKKAGMLIVDSKEQCIQLGNIAHALKDQAITENAIVELGHAIVNNIHRKNDQEIIITNLTGVAVQDIQIANLVYQSLLEKRQN
jgi:ornithine cyclodeaminase